jgi:hypothetical protein
VREDLPEGSFYGQHQMELQISGLFSTARYGLKRQPIFRKYLYFHTSRGMEV